MVRKGSRVRVSSGLIDRELSRVLVLFTRDLRVRDQPALAAAAREADGVLPLFVFDDALLAGPCGSPNRVSHLLDCLRDLDRALRERGSRLYIRRGDPVEEAVRTARRAGAGAIHISEDFSRHAKAREKRLEAACREEGIRLCTYPGRDRGRARRGPAEWRRRPLPRLHAVLARLAGAASAAGRAGAAVTRRPATAAIGAGRIPRCALSAAAPHPPRASRRAARPLRGGGWSGGSAGPSPATRTATTTSRRKRPRGSAPTSTWAASPRRRCSPGSRANRAVRKSPGSSAGGTSTTRSSPPSRSCRAATTALGGGAAGGAMRPRRGPGGRDARGCRSSTRGCASSSARASCTTGRG